MAGNRPEERVAHPLVRQSWRRFTALHWRVDPGELQRHLPAQLRPDVVDGSAWIGLTPFRVERFRILGAPPLPFVSSFPETNLRTYVRTAGGLDGLWFLSLDVTSTSNVVGGRLGGLPYHLSAMSVRADDGVLRYRGRRRLGPRAGYDIAVRPGPPIPDDELPELAALLIGRWRAFSVVAGRLVVAAAEHEPWPLRRAELLHVEQTLTDAAGLPTPTGEPLVHVSPGVDSRLGLRQR